MGTEKETIKSRYERLVSAHRDPYVDRGRDAAKYTIPTLFKDSGDNQHKEFRTPWQSMGAEGVNNLSANLVTTSFPTNNPFFRLSINEQLLKKFEQDDQLAEIETDLAIVEKTVLKDFDKNYTRPVASEALKHVLVVGNVLLYT